MPPAPCTSIGRDGVPVFAILLFLKTEDFGRDCEALSARGVRFVHPLAEQPYGKVAVFENLYGNLWNLIQFADGALTAPQ